MTNPEIPPDIAASRITMGELSAQIPVTSQPPVVRPDPDSRLEQLTARFETADALAKQTAAELKEITDGIKAELQRLHPSDREVLLSSPYLTNPLQLQSVTSWRVDSKALKAADPVTYTRWAKQSTSWRLAPLKAG